MLSSRTLAAAAVLCTLAGLAHAQSPRAGRVRVPVRDAGTLHLSTGEWSRASLGTPVYRNDARQPFFLNLGSVHRVADYGELPGTPFVPRVGGADGQPIRGFEFAYVTREVRGDFGYTISFYDNLAPCAPPRRRTAVARIALGDLPGAREPGAQAAWRVAVDLRGTPFEFVLGQDPSHTGEPARFAWSIAGPEGAHGPGGPLLAGDPSGTFGPAALAGAGTGWSGDVDRPGTGLGNDTAFWAKDRRGEGCLTAIPNAPIAFGSFHLQLYSSDDQALGASTNIGTNYCDGSSAPLFSSGFETGNLAGWEGTGIGVSQGDAWQGDWKARVLSSGVSSGRLIRSIDTTGVDQVTLRYARRGQNLPPQWVYHTAWSDGSEWHNLETATDLVWSARSFDLPPAAGDNPDFKIRFRFPNQGQGGRMEVDSVRLEPTHPTGHIEAFGSLSVADNDLTLMASNVPPGTFGLFFYGPTEVHVPLGDTFRCVGGQPVRRVRPPTQADETGTVMRTVDLGTEPALSGITLAAPVTMHFQYWHRIPGGGSSLTDALRIHFVE